MSTRAAVLPAAFATAVLSLSAQSAPPKPQEPQRPIFRTEANFVRVDVFPTRDGKPVTDLTAADFEVREDGIPQKLESFEFVQVRTGVPRAERGEPNTIGGMREAMRDPRARVFVLFLDVPHVQMLAAMSSREPLVRFIDSVLGPDDLVGIMTPMMAATDVTFARKIDVMTGGLRDRWPWGERFSLAEDQREVLYKSCYPWEQTEAVVAEMKARRRERTTLDALHELVSWLRDQREERKAILTVSEGWALFRPNPDLTRPRIIDPVNKRYEPIPGPEPIGTGPDGRLRLGHESNRAGTKTECDRDRLQLSLLDNERHFHNVMEAANTANASFYTVDPRGLASFDAPIGPDKPPPVSVDMANLRHRIETLRTLAENTDGIAVIGNNDLNVSLRRITDDLSSYYLLGYYSTNKKLDGRFRRLDVRVKKPGIDIRARRGYRSATEQEVTEARTAATTSVPEHVAVAHAALSGLGRVRPASVFSAHAVAVQGKERTTVWIAGETRTAASADATAEVTVTADGATSSASAPIPRGERGFVVPVVLKRRVAAPVEVRVRIPQGAGEAALTDMLRIDAVDGLGHPLLFRRGPSTGNRVQAAGSPVFSRTERARLEIPAGASASLSAGRVLDRNGSVIEVPVTLAERTDAAGQRWLTAEVILAPLAAGDYIVELSGTAGGGEQKVLTAIRVTR